MDIVQDTEIQYLGLASATGVGVVVGAPGAAASGVLVAKGAVEVVIGTTMMSNTIQNMKDDASSTNDNSSSSNNNKETSSTKKEKVETGSDLESATNQREGLGKAQDAAKKEVKGQKQNKIRSMEKSMQREKHQLKRIDINDINN